MLRRQLDEPLGDAERVVCLFSGFRSGGPERARRGADKRSCARGLEQGTTIDHHGFNPPGVVEVLFSGLAARRATRRRRRQSAGRASRAACRNPCALRASCSRSRSARVWADEKSRSRGPAGSVPWSRRLTIMKAKPHPEQGFRSCLGIIGLTRSYGVARLEAASRRGNDIGATSYGSIASILKHGLDKAYATEPAPDVPPIRHGNIRGSGYFH